MRILHLCSSIDPATGGPANVLDRLSRLQAASGHQVTVITADAPGHLGDLLARLKSAGVEAHLRGPHQGPLAKGAGVLDAVRGALARGVDIGHIHGVWQHTPHWGAGLLRRARVPYVFRPCGMLDPWCLAQGALKKKLFLALRGRRDLNAAAALHFTTETERRLVEPLSLAPKPYVIANGIDWDEFDPPPARGLFRRSLGLNDEPLVVFLSRLHYKKGIELLIPAFAQAAPANAMLALVGPGEDDYVKSLADLARREGVGERVKFTGMIKGRARLEALIDADVFCLPSYQENFGVAVAEASGVGTPVLISDQVNICDEVIREKVGVVVPCAVPPLAEALQSMLRDRAEIRAMGERGRAWAARTFDWRGIALRIESMYAEVLARAPG